MDRTPQQIFEAAYACSTRGDFKAAIQEYLLLKDHSMEAVVTNGLGVAYYSDGQLDKAITEFKKSVATNQSSPVGHQSLAVAMGAKQQLAVAAMHMVRAWSLNKTEETTALMEQMVARARTDKAAVIETFRGAFHASWDDHPWFLQPMGNLADFMVEVTTYCNLKCPGCGRTQEVDAGTHVNKHMDPEIYKAVIANAPTSNTCSLFGIGEPTLHPNLLDFVGIARDSGKFRNITFFTNGLSQDIAYFRKAIQRGLTQLTISVDSLDQEMAELLRTGTNVAKLKARIRELAQTLDIPLTIAVTIGRKNADFAHLDALLSQLNEIGGMAVTLTPFMGEDALTIQQENLIRDFLHIAAPFYPNLAIVVSNKSYEERAAQRKEGARCRWPYVRAAVTVDGFMAPCCVVLRPEMYGHLSLAEMSYGDFWRHPNTRKWITGFLDDQQEVCKTCSHNPRA